MIITIDGPAASGKGTVARKLAQALDYAYLDTGVLYRAVGLQAMEANYALDHEEAITDVAQKMTPAAFSALDDAALRGDHVAHAASCVAALPAVRDALLQFQRDFAQEPPCGVKGAVLDGRDTGTVVCPHADRKLFLTASMDVRARRRTEQLQEAGESVTYNDTLEEMERRDQRDSQRETSPMAPSEGCFYLDTTALSGGQTFDLALAYIKTGLVEDDFRAPVDAQLARALP